MFNKKELPDIEKLQLELKIQKELKEKNEKELKTLKDTNNKISIKLQDMTDANIILKIQERKGFKDKTFKDYLLEIVLGKKEDKVGGYIFYFDKNMNLKVYEILHKEARDILKLRNKDGDEAYMLYEYFGTYNNKPIFMIKYPFAISLDVVQHKYGLEETEYETILAYDSKAYYNLLEHTIKRNITKGEQAKDLASLFKEYWIYIVVIIGAVLLFGTPQGKQWLTDIMASFRT